MLLCSVRTRCVKIRRFYLKTENSVQQKSCIKEIINFKRSWFHGHTTHLKDKTKSRTVTVNLPTVEVHKQPPVSLASLYGSALHSILTSIKKYTDSTTLRADNISINKNQSRDQLKTSYRYTNTFHHNKQAILSTSNASSCSVC